MQLRIASHCSSVRSIAEGTNTFLAAWKEAPRRWSNLDHLPARRVVGCVLVSLSSSTQFFPGGCRSEAHLLLFAAPPTSSTAWNNVPRGRCLVAAVPGET